MEVSSEVRDVHSHSDDVAPDADAQRGKPLWRSILEVLIAVGIVVALFNLLFSSVEIEDDNMAPTLRPGQRVLVSLLPYQFTPPQRGDVVIVRDRVDRSKLIPYRVIGAPDDQLNIKSAQVSLNGQPLREPYVPEEQERLGVNATIVGQYQVDRNAFYLLNDNRLDLRDSRSFGTISADEIVGRAWLVYWPLQSLSPVQHIRPSEIQ